MRNIAVGTALAVFVGVLLTVHSLRASPLSGIVHVAVSPGGQVVAGGTSTLTFGYSPAVVTVTPGTTVVWTNKSVLPEPHFVTFLTPNPPPWLIARPKVGKEASKNPLDLEFVEDPRYVLPSELTGAPFRNSGYLWPGRMGPPGAKSTWKTTLHAARHG